MHAAWFAVLASMLTAYAVLDGFDFGAGIVHRFVARTDDERRTVLAAIGPLWDGNEVWLIASGGVFVFAFPRAYAAAFSGLYLALMIVLWLLVLRGVAIELRSKVDSPLWREAWDTIFSGASAAMALVLGVALGNVVRGVPIDATGYFREDLFATPGADGAIDAYTAVLGLFGATVLAAHGATFLAWKTGGSVGERSRSAARVLWVAALAGGAIATACTALWEPRFFGGVIARPWVWPLPAVAVAAGVAAVRSLGSGPTPHDDRSPRGTPRTQVIARERAAPRTRAIARERAAFLASCTFVAAMLVATAAALYPVLLRSTLDDAFTLDAHNAASDPRGLATGLALWLPAIVLAVGYFTYLFRSFRGKVGS